MKYIDKAIEILNYLLKFLEFAKEQNLGALIDEIEDERNVPASTVLPANTAYQREYLNPIIEVLETYNQKRLGVCVGTAHTTQMELLYPEIDFSVRFAYRMAKYIDGYKGEGTWGKKMAQVHNKYGAATTKTRPENFNLVHWLYINFTFTKEEIAEAKNFKIKGYVFAKSDEEIKGAIMKYGAVTTTIKAKSMWNNLNGYHRVAVVGWNRDGWIFRNSWGRSDLLTLPYNEFMKDTIAYIKTDTDKKKIDNHIKKVEKKYKYFTAKEVIGLKPELIEKLDKARGLAGIPFSITSGFRTKADNIKIGGAKDSSHLTGMAVDLRVRSSAERFVIIKSLLDVGIKRIGVYNKHIHADIDIAKGEELAWIGTSK